MLVKGPTKALQRQKCNLEPVPVSAVLGLHQAVPEPDEAPEAPGQPRRWSGAPEVQVQL